MSPNNRSASLNRTLLACKVLSIACKIVVVMVAIWGIAATALMIGSLMSSEPNEAVAIGWSVPVVYAIYTATFCVLPVLLGRMVGDITRFGTPFTSTNTRRLFALGWVFLLYAALEALLIAIDTQFLVIAENDSIQVGTLVYEFASHSGSSFNMFPYVLSGVFFTLSAVFKYGVLLQQESDETL